MPKIDRWAQFPEGVRQHLIDRMRDRAISVADLNQLRLWIDTQPEVPEERLVQRLRIIQAVRSGLACKDILASWPGRKGQDSAINQNIGH
jgi:hypothetical protein